MENCNFGRHEHKPLIKVHHNHTHDHNDDHEHEHSHDHRGKDKKVLKIALAITFITMIVEFAAGFIGHSLALISDAIHMFTHSFALIISLIAIVIANKKAPSEKTFGYYRIEVLAAFVNGVTIVLSIAWILYEAIERFLNPTTIDLKISMIVAVIGLVVNIITGIILMQGDRENINLKSAFMHMLSDALSSVAIIIGYIVIYFTEWYFIDIILALLVAFVIGKWAYTILKASTNTLLESSPIEIKKIEKTIREVDENILHVHDLHVWEITQDMLNLTVHVKINKTYTNKYHELIEKINHKLKHDYNIAHTTVQVEWTA